MSERINSPSTAWLAVDRPASKAPGRQVGGLDQFGVELDHAASSQSGLATERTGRVATDEVRQLMPLLVSKMLETMMPHGPAVAGAGLSGDMWRTLLARQLSEVAGQRIMSDQLSPSGGGSPRGINK
jgi:hypothetical protein